MLGGILVNAVLFHLILDFFFSAMQICRSHSAGHGYGVTSVMRKLDRVAVKLPSGAIFGRELVFFCAIATGQTARQGTHLRAFVLRETNRRNQ